MRTSNPCGERAAICPIFFHPLISSLAFSTTDISEVGLIKRCSASSVLRSAAVIGSNASSRSLPVRDILLNTLSSERVIASDIKRFWRATATPLRM